MSKVHRFRSSVITKEENGIIHFRAEADDVYDKQDMIDLLDIMEQASNGEPFLVLMNAGEHKFLMTPEARELFKTYDKARRLIIADAAVINSLSTRILFNLLNMVNKPPFPFKAFETEEDAIAWLSSQKVPAVNNS